MCQLLVQINIDLLIFIPATQTLVSALQQLKMLDGDLGGLGRRKLVTFVGDGVAENVLVYEQRFAIVAGVGVEGGKEVVHLEGGSVEGAPDTTQIVAHVFAEVDGGFLVAMGELRFHEATADVDDDGGRP
jgi:hypothetical protein